MNISRRNVLELDKAKSNSINLCEVFKNVNSLLNMSKFETVIHNVFDVVNKEETCPFPFKI